MKWRTIKFIFVICLWALLLVPGSVQATGTQERELSLGSGIGLSFKLYGGGSYLSGGDINDHLKGVNNRWNDSFFIDFKGPEPEYIHTGFDFGGEFIVNISPRLGIGFGAGYIQASKKSTLKSTWYGVYPYEDTFSPKVRVIPLTFSLHYSLVTGRKINFTASAGAGCYLGKLNWNYTWVMSDGISSYEEMWTGSSNSIGFNGGFGLEYNFSSSIAFVVEGIGRYAKLKNLKGEFNSEFKTSVLVADTVKDSVLWSCDYKDFITNKTYPNLIISKDKPSGIEYSNVREGEVDLSGFSIRAGIKIRIK